MSTGNSLWAQYDFHGKVVEILRRYPDKFLTAYQLAIEIAQNYQRCVDYPDYPVGGEGSGNGFTLTLYLANQLPDKIGTQIFDIEMARLSHSHMSRLAFNSNGQEIRATTIQTWDSQAIFRIRPTESEAG